MLIKFFKSNYLLQIHIFFLVGILLWLGAFIHPHSIVEINNNVNPFYTVIYNFFKGKNILNVIIALLLLFIEAIILNFTVSNNKLTKKNTFACAFIYFLLMSFSPDLLTLHPVLIANFFLILALNMVFKIYGKRDAFAEVFNASFLISIASFFYFPAIFFILLIWLSFLVYRLQTWHEFVISILGLILPYIFLASYYFWIDKLGFFVDMYLSFFYNPESIVFNYNTFESVSIGFITILLFFSIINFLFRYNENLISIRKKIAVIILLLLVSILSLIYANGLCKFNESIIFIPVSVLITFYLSFVKRKFWAKTIFTLLILSIVISIFFI